MGDVKLFTVKQREKKRGLISKTGENSSTFWRYTQSIWGAYYRK